jgi:predicted nucleotidyltransferase
VLRIFRRHRALCPHRSERYRRCGCPIYVERSLGGEEVRKSLNQKACAMTEIQHRRADILRIAQRHGARNIRVFGSEARGQARPGSDLDLLVDMEPDRSLLDLVGLEQELEDLLGRRVDVLTAASVDPSIRASILADARPL